MTTILFSSALTSGVFNITALTGLFVLILELAGKWKVYEKAREKGYKCLIPGYNIYMDYKIVGHAKMGKIALVLTVLSVALYTPIQLIVTLNAPAFTTGLALHGSQELPVVILWALGLFVALAVVCIPLIIFEIIRCVALSHAFGHKGFFAVGLLILTTLFTMILGFGKSEYMIDENGNLRKYVQVKAVPKEKNVVEAEEVEYDDDDEVVDMDNDPWYSGTMDSESNSDSVSIFGPDSSDSNDVK